MKIKVIGCSGAEFPGHNAPGFLLNDEILFDAGSFTSVMNEKAQFKLRNIFITHAHIDHIRSIPFLADNIVMGKKQIKIRIFSISPVIKTIKRHLFNDAVWPDFTIIPNPTDAILNLVNLKVAEPIDINSYTITPYKVNHTVPAVGYLTEDTKGKSFFYTGDMGPSPQTWERMNSKRLHCLIIDVSFPNSMNELAKKTGHLTPELLREELLTMKQLPENVCITHPKPQYFKTIKKELDRLGMRNLRILKEGETIKV
jgi:ribonuclease BN (tRNA processing enzyme)